MKKKKEKYLYEKLTFRGVPIIAGKDIPKNEIWFMKDGIRIKKINVSKLLRNK